MPSAPPGLLAAIVTHVTTVGDRPPARRAAARWANTTPALAGLTPATALARVATTAEADTLVDALAPLCPGCEWAALTALAAFAPRLRAIVSVWAARGAPAGELADLEAELVAQAWAALRHPDTLPPGRPHGPAVVGRAWSATRTRRATDLRRASRQVPLAPAASLPGHSVGPTVEETITTALVDAVDAGRVTPLAARALYATRITGHPTDVVAGRLGTTPGTVRVLRARAAGRIVDGWAA